MNLEPLDLEGLNTSEDTELPAAQNQFPDEQEEQVEIEVQSDVPKKDRGRKPSDPPQEVTDEELNQYSQRAKERIKHFTKGYHDERRAKEQALREREAAERLAQAAYAELKNMRDRLNTTQKVAYGATKTHVESAFEAAQREYKNAYEAGDSDALAAANLKLIELQQTKARLSYAPQDIPEPLQPDFNQVYSQVTPAQQQAIDEKAVAWHSENPWFRQDPDMTAFAEGLHKRLLANGVDPRSDEYYEAINVRMRKAFPEHDWGDSTDDAVENESPAQRRAERKPASIVAPATRSTAPKKIRLTEAEVAVARRLGVSLEDYARQKQLLENGAR